MMATGFRSVTRLGVACMILAAVQATALADVKPNHLFTDGAVLQQGRYIPVWGKANPDEVVTVRFRDQVYVSIADDRGYWRVTLHPLEAGGPNTMTIRGDNTIHLKDILVGEVWIASGQSNMQWSVSAGENPEEIAKAASDSGLRLFTVPRTGSEQPKDDIDAHWEHCTPETVRDFSAVAYHFGKDLRANRHIPVGIISTNVGGTAAELWTSREMLEAVPALQELAGKNGASSLYNAMIHPLAPFAFRGAIWYQGESNADRAEQYRKLFPAMIADWRRLFEQGDFPFLFVQLAPFMKKQAEPGESRWAELREAQLLTLDVAHRTAMAVITDLGDENDIHPKPKGPVGTRLALAARAIGYGEEVAYSGPTLVSAKFEAGKAILTFRDTAGGLVARGGELSGFTIAGKDGKFSIAKAEIVGLDTVVVSSPDVAEPLAVRYGWANYPVVNLTNKVDLPASPFRTDVPPTKD